MLWLWLLKIVLIEVIGAVWRFISLNWLILSLCCLLSVRLIFNLMIDICAPFKLLSKPLLFELFALLQFYALSSLLQLLFSLSCDFFKLGFFFSASISFTLVDFIAQGFLLHLSFFQHFVQIKNFQEKVREARLRVLFP